MKKSPALGAFALVLAACAESNSPPVLETTPGFAHPESVVGAGKRRFVSNIGKELAPDAKDGDGFISELDERGGLVELVAFPKGGPPLHAPKGLAVASGTLFVADVDRVVGFDLVSRQRTFEAELPAAAKVLANDLAAESDEALLVTDTFAGTVYRLRLGDRSFETLATGIGGANGVAVDKARGVAWVAGIGPEFGGGDLFEVPLEGGPAKKVEGVSGLLDGVAVLSDGSVVVSDWVTIGEPQDGVFIVYPTAGKAKRTVTLPGGFHGPADFFYDAASETLWVPRTLDGSVSIVDAR